MALNYLEALNISTDEADDCHTGWCQLKMMSKGEERQTLQSLINNGTITQEYQKMPQDTLDVIGTAIKAEDHFWHFGMSFSPICTNSLMRVSMPYWPVSVTSLPSVNFPTPTVGAAENHGPPTCSTKSWGKILDLSPGPAPAHLPVPSHPMQLYLSHDVSSFRRPTITAVTSSASSIHAGVL